MCMRRQKNRPGGGTVMNPLYDLYRMPRNIDMDYYKKIIEEKARGLQTSTDIIMIRNSGLMVLLSCLDRCNNGPIFHRVTIIPIG